MPDGANYSERCLNHPMRGVFFVIKFNQDAAVSPSFLELEMLIVAALSSFGWNGKHH